MRIFEWLNHHYVFRAALHHVRLCRTHASAICDQKVKYFIIKQSNKQKPFSTIKSLKFPSWTNNQRLNNQDCLVAWSQTDLQKFQDFISLSRLFRALLTVSAENPFKSSFRAIPSALKNADIFEWNTANLLLQTNRNSKWENSYLLNTLILNIIIYCHLIFKTTTIWWSNWSKERVKLMILYLIY